MNKTLICFLFALIVGGFEGLKGPSLSRDVVL